MVLQGHHIPYFKFSPTMHPLHLISFSVSPETTPEDILTETCQIWFPLPFLNLLNILLTPWGHAQTTPKSLAQLWASIVVLKLPHNPDNPAAPAILGVTACNPSLPNSWKHTHALLHSLDYCSHDNQPLCMIPVMTCTICHSATCNTPTCPFSTSPLWYRSHSFCLCLVLCQAQPWALWSPEPHQATLSQAGPGQVFNKGPMGPKAQASKYLSLSWAIGPGLT